jgi:hypothetical protein
MTSLSPLISLLISIRLNQQQQQQQQQRSQAQAIIFTPTILKLAFTAYYQHIFGVNNAINPNTLCKNIKNINRLSV